MRPVAAGATDDAVDPPPLQAFLALAARRAVHLVEVLDGVRPLQHLERDASPAVTARLRHWRRTSSPFSGEGWAPDGARTSTGPVRVRRVRCHEAGGGAIEAVVVLERAGRVRAVAVRFERHRDAWRTVELAPPECGLPALPTASIAAPRAPDTDLDGSEVEDAGGEGSAADD